MSRRLVVDSNDPDLDFAALLKAERFGEPFEYQGKRWRVEQKEAVTVHPGGMERWKYHLVQLED